MKKYIKPTVEIETAVQDTNISSGGSTCSICIPPIEYKGILCAVAYGRDVSEFFTLGSTELGFEDVNFAYSCVVSTHPVCVDENK